MKFIGSRWFVGDNARFFVAIAVIAILAASGAGIALAATAPRYGGTLVVELHVPTLVLDPMKWKIGAPEYAASAQIAAAVFDRLVTLDRFGRFQPDLATEWSHDAGWRRWQFSLRSGVQFSDGSALSAADVTGALQELFQGKAVVTATGTRVVVQFPSAMPDLLEQLASQRYFIYRREADGTLLGTGAFFVKEFTPAASGTAISRYRLAANEHCWAGRPFVDVLEVSVGVPVLRQFFDLQLGKADVVEISPDLMRRAAQENLRVWASAPVLLYALMLSGEAPLAVRGLAFSPRMRDKTILGEALSLALDRATMANVLLQRQAEPATSFLPQWLSGYAFVFTAENDVDRAKLIADSVLTAKDRPGVAWPLPLPLRVDASGDLAKLIAERVAINARQAGVPVQVQSHSVAREVLSGGAPGAPSATGTGKAAETAALRLVAWRYSSLSERAELDTMVATLQLAAAADEKEKAAEDTEQLYLRERRLIAERELIPLVAVPEYIGLGADVRDWVAERWGEWHLADVWLDGKRTAGLSAPVGTGIQP